jgi:hypothetical protein
MTNPTASPKRNAQPGPEWIGSYWGIVVQVIERMENCSLIRHRDRELVVDSEDLQICRAASQAA